MWFVYALVILIVLWGLIFLSMKVPVTWVALIVLVFFGSWLFTGGGLEVLAPYWKSLKGEIASNSTPTTTVPPSNPAPQPSYRISDGSNEAPHSKRFDFIGEGFHVKVRGEFPKPGPYCWKFTVKLHDPAGTAVGKLVNYDEPIPFAKGHPPLANYEWVSGQAPGWVEFQAQYTIPCYPFKVEPNK